jgi:hypothetical protein
MDVVMQWLEDHRKAVYVVILAACALIGLILSLLFYNQSLGLGDQATFYEFARNISHGEVFYKDFIHFRTPGSAVLYALFIKIFGEKINAVNFGISIETQLLYPLTFLISAIILLRSKKSPLYLIFAFLMVIFLPGYIQLRAGFGLLAIAVYLMSFENREHVQRKLLIAGILTGITFSFGQEIALMVAVIMGAGELINRDQSISFWSRLKPLIIGAVIGVAPLLLYVLLFSNIVTFLYYVFYYAFIIQPKYMNVPIPSFGYDNFIYYLPFILYGLCFLVIYANRKLGKVAGLLLGFGILRLITELGRSDIGHLIFAIPEIFIIVPLCLVQVKNGTFDRKTLRRFTPYGIMLIVLFLLAMKVGSSFLVLTPFVILYALYKRPNKTNDSNPTPQAAAHVYLILGSALLLLVYLFFPYYQGTVLHARDVWRNRHIPMLKIDSVVTDPVDYQEVTAVTAAVVPIHPATLFAFPIEPFFYTLAPHHASRYLTFESETTLAEQDQTISDLQHSKPQVVIVDPLQAQGESASLWKISNYLTSNYTIIQTIANRDIFWVMTPKQHPGRQDELTFQLYQADASSKFQAANYGIESPNQGINNGISQASPDIHFTIDASRGAHLTISLIPGSGIPGGPTVCGTVVIQYADMPTETTICSNSDTITIPISKQVTPVSIHFRNTTANPIIWNNPVVTQ